MLTHTDRRRFPGLRFPVPLVATLALLAIVGALVLPATAQAQTATTLVSNIGQTSDAQVTLSHGDLFAQSFKVASGGGNYTLKSIEAPIVFVNITALTAEDRALLSASLWSADEFGEPGSSLQALTIPSSISDGDNAAFTDPAGTTLEAGKLYAVVFAYDKTATELNIKAVGSASEDGESLSGWSIRNNSLLQESGDTSWDIDGNSLQIRVNGTAVSDTPTLSTDATLSALSLGTGVTLDPTFASGTYAYTASVANSVEEVTVAPTTTDTDATFEYLDSSDNTLADADTNTAGQQVDLDVGDTVFKVKVTAEDDTTTQTYTVTVTRACALNTGDIWCGVVTVGDVTNNDGDTIRHGFVGTTGGLTDETFSLMFETGTTNNYTISAIVVDTSEQLYFVTSSGLTDTEEESLALHVDGESAPFVFSDTTQLIAGSYRWPARTDLDWSSETTVTLRLREFPRPTVTNVEVTSDPGLETDTYGAGETIEVSVTFSEAVEATSDTDFVLSVAGAKRAPLLRGSETATLVFGYTVVSSDEDTNGIWIGNETRTLDGNRGGEPQNGTITSVATGAAANLDHSELGTDSDHKVDGSRTTENVAPSFTSSATISVAENQTDGGHGGGGGQRCGRQRHGLRDHRRGGPGFLLHRGDLWGADLRRGPQLRGRRGPGEQQHLRGGCDGDQRHGDAGDDRDADHHGDGDRRGHGGAGQAGDADGVGGVGDQPEGELVGAVQRGSAHYELRRAAPDILAGGLVDGEERPVHRGGDREPIGQHLLRRAGAGDQRRGHRRVVGLGQRHDGRGGGPADAERRECLGDRGSGR